MLLIIYLATSSGKTEGPPVTLKVFSLVLLYFKFTVFCHEVSKVANFNIKIGHWIVVVGVVVRKNSALMNLFLHA